MMKVYGIPNCSTVKKAISWLRENDLEYELHDYKKKGITTGKLRAWSKKLGWEKLVNKRGTTWRTVPPERQQMILERTKL